MKKVVVIGAGAAALSAAACLAQGGLDVTVLEKNGTPGGRARAFEAGGFRFDMGPSWYWMPDVFEKFFQRFGTTTEDFYHLKRLDPSYRIYYPDPLQHDIPAGVPALCAFFEKLEPGSGRRLEKFLKEGGLKYALGMNRLVYKPGLSWRELMDVKMLTSLPQLHVFQSLSRYVRRFFHDPQLISLLEFPVLFLGATPEKTPALYSLMNYADMSLGTWYPMGGMHKVIEAMVKTCVSQGVTIHYNAAVTQIEVAGNTAVGVWQDGHLYKADYVVAGADYYHVETALLPKTSQSYSEQYWQSRTLAPSALIFFVGLNKRIANLRHHTLFFDGAERQHFADIYEKPQWPSTPLFYVCCPSKTDPEVAPAGAENLFILVPVAPGLEDNAAIRREIFDKVMSRIEKRTGESLVAHIVYKKSYAQRDFINDYNAFKGNAYGLANTLLQTANLKPRMRSRKVANLFYAGQLTVPGPGLPPAIISGQVAADALFRQDRKT